MSDEIKPPECMLCDRAEGVEAYPIPGRDMYGVDCPTCGRYSFHPNAGDQITKGDAYPSRHLLSGLTRAASDRGAELELLSTTLDDLVASAHPPKDPMEAMDRLLHIFHDRTGRLGEWVHVREHEDYPLIFSDGPEEFRYHLGNLATLGLLEIEEVMTPLIAPGHRLSVNGWKRIAELGKTSVRSTQAFVAMWFHKDLDGRPLHGVDGGRVPQLPERTGGVPVIRSSVLIATVATEIL